MTIGLNDVRRCHCSAKQRVGEMTFQENDVAPFYNSYFKIAKILKIILLFARVCELLTLFTMIYHFVAWKKSWISILYFDFFSENSHSLQQINIKKILKNFNDSLMSWFFVSLSWFIHFSQLLKCSTSINWSLNLLCMIRFFFFFFKDLSFESKLWIVLLRFCQGLLKKLANRKQFHLVSLSS